MPVNKETLLRVENLSVRVDQAQIFENISFIVERGNILAIIGPNGGGKTTLLKCLLGLLPYQGTVAWQGDPRIGYVPQRFSLDRYFPLIGREFLELIIGGSAADRRNIPENLLHDHSLLERRVGAFSAGELQRFLIAAALLRNPDILLLDEPTADLDAVGEESISKHIFHLAKERRLAVILVSHDLQLVYREVDQVLCLNRQLVCYGPPRSTLTERNLQDLYGGAVNLYEHTAAAQHHDH